MQLLTFLNIYLQPILNFQIFSLCSHTLRCRTSVPDKKLKSLQLLIKWKLMILPRNQPLLVMLSIRSLLPAVISYSSHFLPLCISHSAASYTDLIPVVFIDFLALTWIPKVENFLPESGWEVTLDLCKLYLPALWPNSLMCFISVWKEHDIHHPHFFFLLSAEMEVHYLKWSPLSCWWLCHWTLMWLCQYGCFGFWRLWCGLQPAIN